MFLTVISRYEVQNSVYDVGMGGLARLEENLTEV